MTLIAYNFKNGRMYSDTTVSTSSEPSHNSCKIFTYEFMFQNNKTVRLIIGRAGNTADTTAAIETFIQELIRLYKNGKEKTIDEFERILNTITSIDRETTKTTSRITSSNYFTGSLLITSCRTIDGNVVNQYNKNCINFKISSNKIDKRNLKCFNNYALIGAFSSSTTLITNYSVLDLFVTEHNKNIGVGGYLLETDFACIDKSNIIADIAVELSKQILINNGMDKKYIGLFNRKHSAELKNMEKMYLPIHTKIDLM